MAPERIGVIGLPCVGGLSSTHKVYLILTCCCVGGMVVTPHSFLDISRGESGILRWQIGVVLGSLGKSRNCSFSSCRGYGDWSLCGSRNHRDVLLWASLKNKNVTSAFEGVAWYRYIVDVIMSYTKTLSSAWSITWIVVLEILILESPLHMI